MKGYSYFVLIPCLLINSLFANAAENIEASCDQELYIIHGNGMFTSEAQAEANLMVLQQKVEWFWGPLLVKEKLKFEVAYNNDVNLVEDFYEVYTQWSGEGKSQFWAMLAGLEHMPEFLQEAFLAASTGIIESLLVSNPNVQEHVAMYNKLLKQGNKVMLVPHSQGNFFGNIAYVGLDEEYKEGFLITQTASPASYIASDPTNSRYTTIEEDLFMKYVPDKLPANIVNFSGVEKPEWTGHSFIDSYLLEGSKSFYSIMFDLYSNIRDAKFPNSFDGYRIPFHLRHNWTGNFDLDMHITEPDGTHVYSGNPEGTSGVMLNHSTGEPGVETYELNCRLNLTGVYKIGFQRVTSTPEYVWDSLNFYIDDAVSPYSGVVTGLGYSGQDGSIVWDKEFEITVGPDGGYSTRWTYILENHEPLTPFKGLFYLQRL